jgi:hypothetical protein
MINCPNCGHQETSGALFCSECGAQLNNPDEQTTQSVNTKANQEKERGETARPTPLPPATWPEAWLYLHVLASGQVLPLANHDKFTLGRVSQGQPIMPDIDLSPYQAYACGVSRLHAVIKRAGPQAVIMDLDTSNGTFVNGTRLSANIEHPLSHADIISLGKLKLQVLLKKP